MRLFAGAFFVDLVKLSLLGSQAIRHLLELLFELFAVATLVVNLQSGGARERGIYYNIYIYTISLFTNYYYICVRDDR